MTINSWFQSLSGSFLPQKQLKGLRPPPIEKNRSMGMLRSWHYYNHLTMTNDRVSQKKVYPMMQCDILYKESRDRSLRSRLGASCSRKPTGRLDAWGIKPSTLWLGVEHANNTLSYSIHSCYIGHRTGVRHGGALTQCPCVTVFFSFINIFLFTWSRWRSLWWEAFKRAIMFN